LSAPGGPSPAERAQIRRIARQLLVDLNGGREPESIWQWRRLARRFHIRLHLRPACALPAPLLWYDYDAMVGDLFLPRTRCARRLHLWLRHEMIEFLLDTEVAPIVVYPPEWGSLHILTVIATI
jgi:hypothetical protein